MNGYKKRLPFTYVGLYAQGCPLQAALSSIEGDELHSDRSGERLERGMAMVNSSSKTVKQRGLSIDGFLCIGCGICEQSCPQGAIRVLNGRARINPARCKSCGLCVEVCPRGAIRRVIPREELLREIQEMKKRTGDILARITKLEQQDVHDRRITE